MAVVEIAKIQLRRGNARSTGMPQLDTGELGWAISGTDPNSTAPELFIGNKTADGASITTNTRILTTLDLPNIFTSSITTSTYYYSGNRSMLIYTGPSSTNVARTVKKKLDDEIPNLNDFLTDADKLSGDIGIALQRAINVLYLNSDKSSTRDGRIPLRIPAGSYVTSATIYIPPYATLVGDGKRKTVISFTGESKPLFQFVDLTSTVGSPVTLNNMVSGTSPRIISISGMTLEFSPNISPNSTISLLRADCALDTIIDNIEFRGNTSTYSTSNVDNAGIEIRGLGGITSRNLKITNCIFDTLYCGIKSDYDIEDITINDNRFQNLYRGIEFGQNLRSENSMGPARTRITKNVFYIIAREAVRVVGTSAMYTGHILSQNVYNNVGNDSSYLVPGSGDIDGGISSIIDFQTFGNVSDNDSFSRHVEINNYSGNTNFIIPISGHVSITDNRPMVEELSDATGTLVKLAHSGSVTNIKIQYHITATGLSRWGDLRVICSSSGVDIQDTYSYSGSGDSGIIFEAAYNNTYNTITISYSGNTVTGQLTYQINQFY